MGKEKYTNFTNGVEVGALITTPTELTVATTLTALDSGSTCYLGTAGGFAVTLPAPVTGLKFKFIVKVAPTSNYTIVTNGSANIMIGFFVVHAIGVGPAVATDADTITFVSAGTASKIGDWCEVESDGTSWYVSGMSQINTGMTVTKAT